MPAPLGHPPYSGCETGGRPIKYTPEFIEQEAIEFEKWIQVEKNLWIESFCFERGYGERRFYEFIKVNDKFSQAYELLSTKQKLELFKGGLDRSKFFPMCALLLSHKHNIHLKTEQKISGDAVNPLAFALQKADGKSKDLINDENI